MSNIKIVPSADFTDDKDWKTVERFNKPVTVKHLGRKYTAEARQTHKLSKGERVGRAFTGVLLSLLILPPFFSESVRKLFTAKETSRYIILKNPKHLNKLEETVSNKAKEITTPKKPESLESVKEEKTGELHSLLEVISDFYDKEDKEYELWTKSIKRPFHEISLADSTLTSDRLDIIVPTMKVLLESQHNDLVHGYVQKAKEISSDLHLINLCDDIDTIKKGFAVPPVPNETESGISWFTVESNREFLGHDITRDEYDEFIKLYTPQAKADDVSKSDEGVSLDTLKQSVKEKFEELQKPLEVYNKNLNAQSRLWNDSVDAAGKNNSLDLEISEIIRNRLHGVLLNQYQNHFRPLNEAVQRIDVTIRYFSTFQENHLKELSQMTLEKVFDVHRIPRSINFDLSWETVKKATLFAHTAITEDEFNQFMENFVKPA